MYNEPDISPKRERERESESEEEKEEEEKNGKGRGRAGYNSLECYYKQFEAKLLKQRINQLIDQR
jgi:hypothetical protein